VSCVTREIVLPVPRERAWELVTEEDELREWLADDIEFEVGQPVSVGLSHLKIGSRGTAAKYTLPTQQQVLPLLKKLQTCVNSKKNVNA